MGKATQFGKYQIRGLLGRGAMAEVYKAFHPTLERDVAIKVIHPHLADDPSFVRRFRREAKVVAALRHPGIVQVHDFEVEDGSFYMVMEFVPGESLQERLATLRKRGERMGLDQALQLFRLIVRAVAYAHNQGVVHRDLKPANVLLTPEGEPVLTDFGLAKIVGAERLADSGAIIGTPTYMSPEQGEGKAGDERSDIYSLGVMLYELTTGIPPFSADSPISVILKHMDEPLPPPRLIRADLPVPIEQVIQKALEKDPADRFQSAQGLLAATEEIALAQVLLEAAPPLDTRCPYRGLRAFEEEHAEFYFGREALVNKLVEELEPIGSTKYVEGEPRSPLVRSARFLAVLGASGSGKSSLVRAGLVPALRTGAVPGSSDWVIRVMNPGSQPLRELAARLAPIVDGEADSSNVMQQLRHELAAHGRALHLAVRRAWSDPDEKASAPLERHLMLIVDQFEEVFTLCRDETERVRFIENLLYATTVSEGRVIVVLTMRADFYHRCAVYRDLASRISDRQVLVGPMNEVESRRAIEQPARQVGLQFEPGLVDTILADVTRQPGALPLLQHALLELWERRRGRLLTSSAYHASGGVVGAIAQRADSLYASFSPEEQAIVRRIMLRLTRPGEGTEDTRRRVTKRELLPGSGEQRAAVEEVLRRLADARLVTTSRDMAGGEEMVDVAHEALIRGWARLQSWINEDRMALHTHRQLTEAADTWEQNDRDASYLYRGVRLAQAEEWVKTHAGDLNELERAFLDASRAAAEAVEREQEAARQRELAQMQALLEEQRQRIEAQTRAHSSHLVTSAQLALQERKTGLALALAMEANRIDDPSPQAQLILAEAAYAPGTRRLFAGHTAAVQSIALGLDGRTLVSGSVDCTLILWDVESGGIVRRFEGHDDAVLGVAMTPDGRCAISSSADRTLILWDLEGGKPVRRFEGHFGPVLCVAVNPDGRAAISGSEDRCLILWNLETGEALRRFEGHLGAVLCVAVSSDGRTAISGSEDCSLILWNLETGEVIHHLKGHDRTVDALLHGEGHYDSVWDVAFGPDGRTALSVSEDQGSILWDLDAGKLLRRFEEPEVGLFSVDLGADGRSALLGALYGQVVILDLDSGQQILQLLGHSGQATSVVLSPDGRAAFSGSADGSLRMWDLQSGAEIRCLDYSPEVLATVDISPDGQMGLAGCWDGSLILWDHQSGVEVRRLIGHTETLFAGAYFGPDGRTVLSGSGDIFGPSDDNTLRLWDVETGKEIRRLEGHTMNLYDIALGSDGRFAVSASADGTVRCWDLASGAHQVLIDVAPQIARSVAISPDGRTVLIGLGKGQSHSPDYDLRLLDLETGQELRRFVGQDGQVTSIAFSPDGRLAISGGYAERLILWNVADGSEIRRFAGHAGACTVVTFGPDGRVALSAGTDNTVILWDVDSGAIRRFLGHSKVVVGAVFSPDGRAALSASDDGAIREWRIDATQEELLAWVAANRYVPELGPQQREQYNIEPLSDEASTVPAGTP
jgi:WD40 repeat protein/tRNA A-37 threonylcarbamoyl transferase component Bud32